VLRKRHSFASRSAIVTGGASGIGLAIGEALRGAGADVVLADSDEATLLAAVESLEGGHHAEGSVEGVTLDVRDRDAVETLVRHVVDRSGSLDYMFNNAGISLGGPTEEMTGPYWDLIVDVNLLGVANGVLAAYPQMVAQGHGHIVNTASAAGLLPAPFAVGYAATKSAVVGLSTSLRPEAAAKGVRITVLCPGMVETPILDRDPPEDLPRRKEAGLSGRAYLEAGGLSPIAAEEFAARALRDVARNRALSVTPVNIRAGWYVSRLSPRLIDAFGRLSTRRVQAAMDRAKSM
jgi:NAD(P)-dependent dehydrogenase (short-subunit alcohol dehydrogenase family)